MLDPTPVCYVIALSCPWQRLCLDKFSYLHYGVEFTDLLTGFRILAVHTVHYQQKNPKAIHDCPLTMHRGI